MRKIKSFSQHFAMALFFLTLTPSNDFYASSHSDWKIKEVLLKKNARANGYKITFQAGDTYLEAVKVVDPETKKLIEGLHRLLYRCSQNGPQLPVPVTFDRGNSTRVRIGCTILIEPKILVLDEPVQ